MMDNQATLLDRLAHIAKMALEARDRASAEVSALHDEIHRLRRGWETERKALETISADRKIAAPIETNNRQLEKDFAALETAYNKVQEYNRQMGGKVAELEKEIVR